MPGISSIDPVSLVSVASYDSAEKRTQDMAKVALAKWLNESTNKQVKVEDVKLITSQKHLWQDREMLDTQEKVWTAFFWSGYIMHFECTGQQYAVHTDEQGTKIVIPLEKKLDALKRKVSKQAFQRFLSHATNKSQAFRLHVTPKLIQGHRKYDFTGPGLMVDCVFIQGKQRGTYIVIADLDGKTKVVDSQFTSNAPSKLKEIFQRFIRWISGSQPGF